MNTHLKPMEIETLMLMADGKTIQEIGLITCRSKFTIMKRIEKLKNKAGVSKETALMASAFRRGWIE